MEVTELNWENFPPNTILITDPSIRPKHGDYAITLKTGQNRASLKQILIDDGTTYLHPVIKGYQTQTMDKSYSLLGVIVQTRLDRRHAI